MNISIIGSGNVGGTLGSRWAKAGHKVTFGTRDPNAADIKSLLEESGTNGSAASNQEAASRSDVLLVATPWGPTRQIVESLGDLSGKVVIDVTNPLNKDFSGLEIGTTTSAAEQVAQWAKGAKVVKAFNTVGFNIMADTKFPNGRVAMFYCGDDEKAKATVQQLAEELGFEPLDAGPLRQARLLEPFAMLWISLALAYGYGRDFAFQMLRRQSA